MTKTITSLSIFLMLFSINGFAANSPPRPKTILELDGRATIHSLVFSPDSQSFVSGGGSSHTNLWDVASGDRKTTFIGHSGTVWSVALSPDGKTLAAGSGDKKVHLWDVASGQIKSILIGHSDSVRGVAFSPGGRTLASASWDRTVRLWDVASGQIKAVLIGHRDRVISVAFSPDGSILASGSRDKTVHLWDVALEERKTTLTGHTWYVNSVAFSPDGSILASGSGDRTVHLWDVALEERKTTLTGHSEGINSIAFSPDGSILASGSDDKTVRLWDVASGKIKSILTGHKDSVSSVAFSPDSKTLASGILHRGDNAILWDLTASATTSAISSLSPASTKSPGIGEQFTVSLNITGGENVTGYQATVVFDPSAVIFFSSANGDYLSDGAFFAAPDVGKNYVTLASAGADRKNGDGTLAKITFQVVDTKASGLFLSQVTLVDPEGEGLFPYIENGPVADKPVYLAEDINVDGVVNIQDVVIVASNFGETGENAADINGDGVVDIFDLVKVAAALGNTAEAPAVYLQTLAMLRSADVQTWLTQAQRLNLTDATSQRGIRFLEQLLAALTPQKTALLPNYPNPFNPETWIPYQLASSSDVRIVIYDTRGTAIRHLTLGHQPMGYYTTRERAAYWDGRNDLGERVASGIYLYQLTTPSFQQTRRLVILK